ncbi:MAG: bacillithiol biosynthesis deacetylase BshB1 [Bacteroidia bacterium]
MKTDILAIGAHPDDVEISAAGTLLVHLALGKTVGIMDLTQGELGTRGTAETRDEEATNAAKILGVHFRENLKMKDGFFQNDSEHQLEIVKRIRKYQPEIVLCNAIEDRHPDHGRSSKLVSDACFLAGLSKIETEYEGIKQNAWRPKAVYHYTQDRHIKPDFVVDISNYILKKEEALRAYKTQFHDPQSDEPQTYISSPEFFQSIRNRNSEFGRQIGVSFAEPFTVERFVGVKNLFDFL